MDIYFSVDLLFLWNWPRNRDPTAVGNPRLNPFGNNTPTSDKLLTHGLPPDRSAISESSVERYGIDRLTARSIAR